MRVTLKRKETGGLRPSRSTTPLTLESSRLPEVGDPPATTHVEVGRHPRASRSSRRSLSQDEDRDNASERRTGPSPLLQALVHSAKTARIHLDYLRHRHLSDSPDRRVSTVFLAVEPVKRTDRFGRYLSWMEETVFDHLRSARMYIIILWDNGHATRYHSFIQKGMISATSARLGRPAGADVTSTMDVNSPGPSERRQSFDFPPLTPHAFCETFAAENPNTFLTSIGKTSLTVQETEQFLVAWVYEGKRGSEKNRRAFIDRFVNYAVTHDRVWEYQYAQPTGGDQTAAYYLDPVRAFKTPLAWYLWRHDRVQGRRKALEKRNGRESSGIKLNSLSRTSRNGTGSKENVLPLTVQDIKPTNEPESSKSPTAPTLTSPDKPEQGDRVGIRIADGGVGNADPGQEPEDYFSIQADDQNNALGSTDVPNDGKATKKVKQLKLKKKRRPSDDRRRDGLLSIVPADKSSDVLFASPSYLSPASPFHPVKTKPSTNPQATSGRPPLLTTANGVIVPKSNIAILTVGSRGDVQPFIAIGVELKKMGHRVRIATHECFRDFVTKDGGLEFYPLAGDPHELMAYMVKNPGLIPSIESVKSGDIGKKRDMIAAIVDSCWKACTEADPGPRRSSDTSDKSDVSRSSSRASAPRHRLVSSFVAEVIISNPPAFGHIHVAERLSIPLHIMFTMPWSPTRKFPHPLLNVEKLQDYGKRDGSNLNLYSYNFCELLTWQGLGDVINKWRRTRLDLPGVPIKTGTAVLTNLKVPHTYLWSPNLIAKPDDWGHHIDVTGFCFLSSLSTDYEPYPKLREFLDAGPKPIYIGFGSIVIEDPKDMTAMIFEAVKQVGVRAIVSKGWAEFGGKEEDAPDNILLIGNCPHDWLFQQVTAVVHHGGAGTTAAGLRLGCPTVIVPFFGDQPFWGSMVAQAGAGPQPIPHKKMTVESFAEAIRFAISAEAKTNASRLGEKMREENGSLQAAISLSRHLPLTEMRCDVDPTRHAAFYHPHGDMRLSTVAAQVLLSDGRVRKDRLYRYTPKRWVLEQAQGDPASALVNGIRSVSVNVFRGFTSLFKETAKSVRVARKKNFLRAVWEVTKGVGRGLGGLLYYPLKGLGTFMGYMIEGLKNLNTIWDSSEIPSESPMVFGFWDGCAKGFRSLGANVLGAVFDVIWKPIAGVYRSGFFGWTKGFFRALISITTKPVAGVLEFVYLPLKGLVNSVDALLSGHRLIAIEREGVPEVSVSEWESILSNYDSFLQHRIVLC